MENILELGIKLQRINWLQTILISHDSFLKNINAPNSSTGNCIRLKHYTK
jgi:hypothetical protein